MYSAVIFFTLAALGHFPLHHLEHFRVDDGFMVVLDIVLRDFAFIDLGLLCQEIDGVAFLKERITFVFLIAEDTFDGGNAPFFLATGCRDAVFGQGVGYAVVSHALQEQAVDAFDDDCLLPVDHQIPIRATVVAKEALERNTDLSVCKALSLAPSAVLGNTAAFFLSQRRSKKETLRLTHRVYPIVRKVGCYGS